MTFSRVRSIDELYEAVSAYDRVITKDAPLADALNYRLDKPRLETFASTPRGLVYDVQVDADLRDRGELFLEILSKTDLSWKETFYYLDQALNCWQETGQLDRLKEYDLFQSSESREIVGLLGEIDSIFLGMQRFEPNFDGDILVIQSGKLTPLDRSVLPEQFETIDVMMEESFELPPFHVYPSATALVNSVTENVTRDIARDVAVVVDQDSQYEPLLKSEFQKEDIPYMNKDYLTEDENFRTLFKLMRSSLNHRRMRVRDVMPIMHRMNLRVPLKYHDAFLTRYDREELEPFRNFIEEAPGSSFRSVIERYEDIAGLELEDFRDVLDGLGLTDEPVTSEHLNQLEFYLSNFDTKVDATDKGVLFASPKSDAYVDRPIVFYLGMDASWTRAIPDRPWLDHDRHRRNNLEDFQVMLQNGERQYYLVQEHQMNADVTPCFYFNVLFEEDFETFSDREHRMMSGLPKLETRPGFDHEPRDVEVESTEAFSQSSLNTFVKSPREYLFDQLVPTTENVHMRKGQVFHDFAEFYVNHPEVVQGNDRGTFVDIMENAMADLADEFSRQDMRTEFEIGIENIVDFLEHEGYEIFQPKGYEPDRFDRGNVIASEFDDLSITSPISEAWFEDTDLGVRGLVDFIPREDSLVDFKSGRSRSQKKVVEQASPDRFDDPDFQAILYLLHHAYQYPDRTLQFTFFHFLENLPDVLQGDSVLKETLVTVVFFPRTFSDQVPKKTTYEFLIGGVAESNDRRKTLEAIGYDRFRQFFTRHDYPDLTDKDNAEEHAITESFISFCQREFDDYQYVIDGATSAIREIIEFRQKNFFEEDLERFRGFLQDQLNELNQSKMNGFDIENGVEDLDLDDLHHRDLIVDDRHES